MCRYSNSLMIESTGSSSGDTVFDGEFQNFFMVIPTCGVRPHGTHLPVVTISNITFTRTLCALHDTMDILVREFRLKIKGNINIGNSMTMELL